MKLQCSIALRGVASLAVVLLGTNAARADITWVIQPSTSTLSISGQLGQGSISNNVTTITELYNMEPQTDNGTSLFPGYTNSLVTNTAGTMTSIGNNFLTSLNFGNEPTLPTLQTAAGVTQNNGTWLPDVTQITSLAPPFFYGTPQPQNLAGQLVPTGGYANNTSDGGRFSVSTSFGTFSNGTGTKDPVTGLAAAVPMAVAANGTFNAESLAITGQFNLNLAINFSNGGVGFTLAESGTVSPGTGVNPQGTITRGSGGTYVLSVPLPAFDQSGTTGAFYYNLDLGYNLHAVANIAPGDANFDGIVNSQDLALVASNYGKSDPTGLLAGNVNGDGIVNSQDIALIASNWLGKTPAVPAGDLAPVPGGGTPGDPNGGPPANSQSVPEPSTWVLLGLGSLGLMWMRRRQSH